LSDAGAPGAASRAGSLWAYALVVYGRPGVAARLLELQDTHGQSVPYLIWSLWMAASGRAPDAATLEAGAALARAWEAAAVAPLRRLRRELKTSPKSLGAGPERRRERLRGGVQKLELDAERMLLEMLEDASPEPGREPGEHPLSPAESAARAAAVWGSPPPASLLRDLARLAA
jgi:uncharacterized protein (TIGR02444 family)